MFVFELGQKVKISISGEAGEVIGRAEYTHSNPQMQIRYLAADGRAVESWWDQEAIEAA